MSDLQPINSAPNRLVVGDPLTVNRSPRGEHLTLLRNANDTLWNKDSAGRRALALDGLPPADSWAGTDFVPPPRPGIAVEWRNGFTRNEPADELNASS